MMPSKTTPELRGEVKHILAQLENACHRPLFEEIGVSIQEERQEKKRNGAVDVGKNTTSSSYDDGGDVGSAERARSWANLLNQASELAPYMTSDEHGLASKLCAILLLGYFLPNLTGRDLYNSCNVRHKGPKTATAVADDAHSNSGNNKSSLLGNVLDLELEEILETCTATYASQIYGEVGCCTDEQVTTSLRRFIHYGIGPFLASRTAHPTMTDLIHVVAMAISPTVLMMMKPEAIKENQALSSSPSYQRAVRLMNCPHSHSFQLSYADRLELVRMLASNFVAPDAESLMGQEHQAEADQLLPDGGDEQAASAAALAEDSPMIDGALVHLRLALQTFSIGTLSACDTNAVRRALVNIAIASGHVPFIEDAAQSLVEVLADCRNICRCQKQQVNKVPKNSCSSTVDPTCPYVACGNLLRDLILRHNGSRHYADEIFTRQTLILVCEAMESLTSSGVKSADTETTQSSSDTAATSVCQLRSLLVASRNLFYFLLPSKAGDETTEEANPNDGDAGEAMDTDENAATETDDALVDQKKEDEAKDSLMKCAIVLLNHPDLTIVRAAAYLVSLAFAYSGEEYASFYTKGIFTAIKCCFKQQGGSNDKVDAASSLCKKRMDALQGIIAVLSRQSKEFANAVMSNIFNEDTTPGEPILYLASSIALSQPRIVAKYLEFLYLAVEEKADQEKHLIAVYLSCRLAHYFSSEERVVELRQRIDSQMESVKDPWTLFQLARHAFCTANFGIAKEIIATHLLKRSGSEQSHLFYVSVALTARAEHIMSENGALGIPQALPLLQSAKSHLRSLQMLASKSCGTPSYDFSFQLEMNACRIDFLNLCVTLRGLCGEMRLINTGAVRGTRTRLHQRNVMHCFYLLSSRYAKLYRRCGLFHCQQTRTCLRTLSALCRFMARASAQTFFESTHGIKSRLHEFHETAGVAWPEGDASHPITRMITKFSESVLWSMDDTVEPNIRATAMIEMLDPVLKCPLPSPRGYFASKRPPLAEIRLYANPEDVSSVVDSSADSDKAESEGAEVVEVAPGELITLYATGQFPAGLPSVATLPFSQVIAWHKIAYDGPLLPDEDVYGEGQQGAEECIGISPNDLNESEQASSLEAPFAAPIRPDGKFSLPIVLNPINREGYYIVRLTLGCRDARCGEFEVTTKGKNAEVIALCITSQALGDATAEE